jgi:phosphatidylglycerol:prolipoprotein diacylglycerol transferase
MMFVLPFPAIDPVLIDLGTWPGLGPMGIRWYALAYLVGLGLAWLYVRAFVAKPPHAMTAQGVDDLVFWAFLGVVLGGRFGYVLFYNFHVYAQDPFAILRVWEGGMSFHGGLLGVIVAMAFFAYSRKLNFLAICDAVAVATPIGLFLGRLANFVNAELYGRVTDVPWAFVFPRAGPMPRHPSQLYEAALEGLLLFVVLWLMGRSEKIRMRHGVLAGVFLIGYALSRIIVETVREPDVQLGYLLGGTTMGQWLSVPILFVGVYLVVRRRRTA